MAHHSKESPLSNDVLAKLLKKAKKTMALGATGKFPQGKLDEGDGGEIRIGVTNYGRKIIMHFGGPITWIGFDEAQVNDLGDLLKQRAAEARNPILIGDKK